MIFLRKQNPLRFHSNSIEMNRLYSVWVPFIFRWDSLRYRKIRFEVRLRFFWYSFQIPVRFSYIPFRLCSNSVEIPFTITSDELINWINRQKDQNRSQILKIKKISKKREYNKFIETRLLWRFFADYLFT